MSMLKIPMSDVEIKGLEAHMLPTKEHSQLSDAFRCGFKFANDNAKSEWISVSSKSPSYGTPLLLMIDGVVQHVTYCIDGSDDSRDWFEPYGNHVDDDLKRELSFFVDYEKDISWIEVDSLYTPPKQ